MMNRTLFNKAIYFYVGKLSLYLDLPDMFNFLLELEKDVRILSGLEQKVKNVDFFKTKKWPHIFDLGLYRITNYLLVRALKPKVFVETGVLHGLTSVFILSALEKNGKGRLFSIDYPSYFETGPVNQDGYQDVLPPKKQPGWVVSSRLLKYWKLKLGKSVDVLPVIISKKQPIDIFLHDSEHTYATMWSEFVFAWNRLRSGGVLMCDNLESNSSFFDFCSKVHRKPLLMPEIKCDDFTFPLRFGLIRK